MPLKLAVEPAVYSGVFYEKEERGGYTPPQSVRNVRQISRSMNPERCLQQYSK